MAFQFSLWWKTTWNDDQNFPFIFITNVKTEKVKMFILLEFIFWNTIWKSKTCQKYYPGKWAHERLFSVEKINENNVFFRL